jgi:hypothetical protein
MSITLETAVTRNSEILHAPVGTEGAVLMSVEAGHYYGLNAVASRVWELLAIPRTIAQLCKQICEEFEIDTPTCEVTVLKFVRELVDNGIVREATG